MRSRSAERGEGNLGCIFWLLVLAVIGLILWKAVPVRVATAELYDFSVEQTKFSAKASPEELKRRVLNKAKELNLPVNPKQVEVEKTRDRVIIRLNYMVPLDFPGYTYEWKIEEEIDRPIFYL